MGQRVTRRWVWFGTLMAIVMALVAVPLDIQGANQFAAPAFQQQWGSVESAIPNFWGPLVTAREGQVEPYVEGNYDGDPGRRLVQYFDKARMELTNRPPIS